MHTRKFEAETLEEALKAIKRELGPDAIILKTVTNKGLKGAFKKSKIEITAAISEKNYLKKARVEKSLSSEQKELFYQSDSSHISNMIDGYSDNRLQSREVAPRNNGYGKLGLNRPVSQTIEESTNSFSREVSNKVGNKSSLPSSLDDFLGSFNSSKNEEVEELQSFQQNFINEEVERPRVERYQEVEEEVVVNSQDPALLDKIELLEQRIFELNARVQKIDRRLPIGLEQIKNSLRSLDIEETYIQKLIRKATFELGDEELDQADIVFDFALKEMVSSISTDMPEFSKVENEKPVVTVLVSTQNSGQTSTMLKLGTIKQNSVLIQIDSVKGKKTFAEQIFDFNVVRTTSLSEAVTEIRKATEEGKSVFVDFKRNTENLNDSKNFIDGLRRSFDKVEVLICLSSVNSELYNKKIVSALAPIANGLILNYLDLCINYGAIFNLAQKNYDLPFKFFGTGEAIPDDIEGATAERILAGIFKFD